MSGTSSVSLVRSEESTIDMRVIWRDAARVMVADLAPNDGSTIRVKLKQYPSDTVALEITDAAAVSGCALVFLGTQIVRLTIPIAFWVANTASRYLLTAWLETAHAIQEIGSVIVEVRD